MITKETCWRIGCRSAECVRVTDAIDAIYSCRKHTARAAKLNEAVEEMRLAWRAWAAAKHA